MLVYAAAAILIAWQPLQPKAFAVALHINKDTVLQAVLLPEEREKLKALSSCTEIREIAYREILLGKSEITSDNKNAQLAAQLISGTIFKPGEIFSFNRIVGPRTVSRGFTMGRSVIQTVYGPEFVPDVGGGVCQTSTVIYQAAKSAGLEIVERHPHVLSVGYAASGEDAAVVYGSQDMKFRNNRNRPVKILCAFEGFEKKILVAEIVEIVPEEV